MFMCAVPQSCWSKTFLIFWTFNLVQCGSGLTQDRGHTLDLVLNFGVLVLNVEMCVF